MKAYLVLEDGHCFQGKWHGGRDRIGEIVFNTSMSGYQEIASDPSYFNQIVVMTAPMQGNYGHFTQDQESQKFWIEGFVCLQIQNSSRDSAWLNYLLDHDIPVVSELDTRALAIYLRSRGTPWGALVSAHSESQAIEKATRMLQFKKPQSQDWVYLASRTEVSRVAGDVALGPRIAVLDFGSKENILRELKSLTSELVIYPSRSSAEQIMSCQPHGVMLTNGPGDPAMVEQSSETVRELLGKVPIFGICMGHQILARALGAKTYKLKFGHRGANHPIKDSILNRTYVTSQNHGYAVDPDTLPNYVKVSHVNLNDQTTAGIYSEKVNCLGIQYHPEASPGPHEARQLFRYFVDNMIS